MQLAESQNGQYDGILYHNRYSDQSSGAFLDYIKVMNATRGKYNLSPRKLLDGVVSGSDYGEIRSKYDAEYMRDYEKHFIPTSDGRHRLMQYDYMYSGAIKYTVST
jgi:hypothetical protein